MLGISKEVKGMAQDFSLRETPRITEILLKTWWRDMEFTYRKMDKSMKENG